ncbi:MAG: signal peptidase I [Acutalibacteraceae bacterium]
MFNIQSKKSTDYAIRILIYLYNNKENDMVGIKDISKNTKIPKVQVMIVLRKLKKAKWIKTEKGLFGKCCVTEHADDISLYDILQVTEPENMNCYEYRNDTENFSFLSRFYGLIQEQWQKNLKMMTLKLMVSNPDNEELLKLLNGSVCEISEKTANCEPSFAEDLEKSELRPKTKKKRGLWKDIVFYSVLVALVIGAVMLRGNGAVNSFAGYSAFTVLSESMESEIPKGSLVITQQVDPHDLKIGDDITYMNGSTSTITHRIVGIIEKYQDTGQRAFVTKGIMNAASDKDPVPAVNVVGKVIFHNYQLGQIFEFISQYWFLIILFLLLFAGFFAAIRNLFEKEEEKSKT